MNIFFIFVFTSRLEAGIVQYILYFFCKMVYCIAHIFSAFAILRCLQIQLFKPKIIVKTVFWFIKFTQSCSNNSSTTVACLFYIGAKLLVFNAVPLLFELNDFFKIKLFQKKFCYLISKISNGAILIGWHCHNYRLQWFALPLEQSRPLFQLLQFLLDLFSLALQYLTFFLQFLCVRRI